ncbi:class I SAM-dependent methyltransferase [Rufibacter glacialis]|uniref:Class I SAM-dependent methyltransferase n=1 Tax=Rufibacter glacialis TaxID=1259555 RepID=A0A5M8QTW4_9BACT|nr:class I SAM-dependent methyltransferase [Rufibacter glacialis]KAA6437632.1 class I SAM-dependent methyltransferase [Rufibacter glacialis]GGK57680.1 type 12 methyltransferase [Rufibacter glacialis]
MDSPLDYIEVNRHAWNLRTGVHKDSAFYDLKSFKEGKNSLNALELEALGEVRGKKLLHLQCHFGQDTLSWARLGAKVTGVDLSDEAIALARQLNQELGLDAEFVCCNVYDLPQHLEGQFDVVFTSYGVIGWLPDLERWAQVVTHFLKPGGTFFLAEFHPVVWMFTPDFSRVAYSYFNNGGPIIEGSSGTYTDREAPIKYTEYSWNHGLSEVLGALLRQNLQLQAFQELPYSYYNCFENLQQGADGHWRIIGLEEKLPLMYSLLMVKPLS